jgi:hypothetical protein
MTTLLIDSNSLQAQSFIDFAKTLPFVKSIEASSEQSSRNIYQAASECNAITVDAFFCELDNRIKNHFHNV